MSADDFISKIAPFAMAEQMRSGVLASITIAQAALESGWGSHAPNNNLFGIKSFNNEPSAVQETQEFYNGKMVTTFARFRSYPSWAESIIDHSNFILRNPRYRIAGFFTFARNLDFSGCAHALQVAGYATDPSYAEKLCKLIVSRNLNRYDKEASVMLQELQELRQEIEKIKNELNMSDVPSWAADAVNDAVKAGILKEAKGGSLDFYRLIVILHRRGLI